MATIEQRHIKAADEFLSGGSYPGSVKHSLAQLLADTEEKGRTMPLGTVPHESYTPNPDDDHQAMQFLRLAFSEGYHPEFELTEHDCDGPGLSFRLIGEPGEVIEVEADDPAEALLKARDAHRKA